MANGNNANPPAVNCHEVKVKALTGGCHRRLKTVPAAIENAPANPAIIPKGSKAAFGVKSNIATPNTPAIDAIMETADKRLFNSQRLKNSTINGCTAPTVAATPPGKRYAAINNSHQNKEKFKTPNTTTRNHQMPNAFGEFS